MITAIINWVRREPVRAITVLNGLLPLITMGLILFNLWNPTIDQLAYINGLPAAIGTAIGVTIVRNAVMPMTEIERYSKTLANAIREGRHRDPGTATIAGVWLATIAWLLIVAASIIVVYAARLWVS